VFVRHGGNERVFRLEFVSNSDFLDSEFAHWKQACEAKGVNLPTVDFLQQKLKDIHKAMVYEFKEDDVEKVHKIVLCLLKFQFCTVF
jgi:RNA polymerase-associated protein RTF1